MSHDAPDAYQDLIERLNRNPESVPPTATLHALLRLMFDEREARLLSVLPLKPFTADQAAGFWQMEASRARDLLEKLAERAIILDMEFEGKQVYVMPPPMAGFIEFALMRTAGEADPQVLGELFYRYLNVEEDFIRDLSDGETKVWRVFVQEPAVKEEEIIHVLDYERATQALHEASHLAVNSCYCRFKAKRAGHGCDSPTQTCMTLNENAIALVKHGHARTIEISEALELLDHAYESNLVQSGENVREKVNFLCNCCRCCCDTMNAARKFGVLRPVSSSNFVPVIAESCNGCGRCARVCPVGAMESQPRQAARNDPEQCLGCGVCSRSCPMKSIRMVRRPKRLLTPLNTAHRMVLMALERGKLQDLIFDNRLLANHRAMAAILGTILRLPPAKQLLATRQVKSQFLESVIRKMKVT